MNIYIFTFYFDGFWFSASYTENKLKLFSEILTFHLTDQTLYQLLYININIVHIGYCRISKLVQSILYKRE